MKHLSPALHQLRSNASHLLSCLLPSSVKKTATVASGFPMHWVTPRLAVGPAPSTQAQLAAIKEEKISCILNLCAEMKELPTIQEEAGFEVYYLPIEDEEAPDLAALDKALDWLDEQLFLGKHVYIHCRHGIGRTGTVLNAYLLRRGLGHRRAAKVLHSLRAAPANFTQWRTVRKYGAENTALTIKQPTVDFGEDTALSLAPFIADYDHLQTTIDDQLELKHVDSLCGKIDTVCCHTCVPLSLIEALALASHMNTDIPSHARTDIIQRAADVVREEKMNAQGLHGTFCLFNTQITCPLLHNGTCMLYEYRPFRCRLSGIAPEISSDIWNTILHYPLEQLSSQVFLTLTGKLPDHSTLMFTIPEVLSGKYVQRVFSVLKNT